MADLTMRAESIIQSVAVVQRLLLIHAPLPKEVDGGKSGKAGVKLRRLKRTLSEVAESIEEEVEAVRVQASRSALPQAAQEVFAAAHRSLMRTEHTLSVPELLTREDWDQIPMQAPHVMPNASADGQPVTVTLRKTEADIDTLGPLVSDPDNVG